MWSLSLVEAPSADPISVEDVRAQLRQEGLSADNGYLKSTTIPAAVDRGEQATQRQFLEATWLLTGDSFPACGWVEFPKPPLLTVVSVEYDDSNDVEQTWAASNYDVVAPEGPRCARGRLALANGVSWPSTYPKIGAVRITFTAGYGEATESLPALLRLALLVDAATLYLQRDVAIDQIAVPALYKSFRSYARQAL